MSRTVRFAPLVILLLIVGTLVWRLATPASTTVPSKLQGRPVPEFSLPVAVPGKAGLKTGDLVGQPRILNVFASWCVPCVEEVKVLAQLHERGIPVDGIAVRDRSQDLAAFLARNGDPYERIGIDPQSRVQIALGSSGVPESFVIDGHGVIRYQHIGALEEADIPDILARLGQAR